MGNTSNIPYQDKFCQDHIGDHSALDTGQGQIAFSPTFSLNLKWAANFKFGNTSVTALRLV